MITSNAVFTCSRRLGPVRNALTPMFPKPLPCGPDPMSLSCITYLLIHSLTCLFTYAIPQLTQLLAYTIACMHVCLLAHTHAHMPDISIDEVRKEIETSNKIFLKELGEIPTLFAFPYGETTDEIIELVKEFNFKVAFGQHSGIINETSNM